MYNIINYRYNNIIDSLILSVFYNYYYYCYYNELLYNVQLVQQLQNNNLSKILEYLKLIITSGKKQYEVRQL